MRQRHGTSQSMLAMRDYWSAAQIMARSRIRNVHQAQRSQDLQCYRWAIRPLPAVKLRASLQTLRQNQGSWESSLTFYEIDEKETSARARSIRDKGKGVATIGNCGDDEKQTLGRGIRERWLKSLVIFVSASAHPAHLLD